MDLRLTRFTWNVRASAALYALLLVSGACNTVMSPDAVVMSGAWGGEHVALTVTATGASVEFDCAHGTIGTPLPLNRGAFDVGGEYVQEHGGPIRSDETVVPQAARYTGTVDGKTMTLRVRLTAAAEDIGPFGLTLGSTGRVFKCL